MAGHHAGGPEYRQNPDSVNRFSCSKLSWRSGSDEHSGEMNPVTGPDVIYRYNRYRAAKLIGQTTPGFSAGQSATAMEEVARKNLPAGFNYGGREPCSSRS
jgi:multidrug efflux pump subunit AcrB